MLTYLCDEDPLYAHFYVEKWGFQGYAGFLFFDLKHRLFLLVPTIYVLTKNKKNCIYLKFIIFTVFKNRCILHRHVCVMGKDSGQCGEF